MELKSLISKENVVEVEYPGLEGFVLKLSYLSRDEMLKIRKKCTRTVFNKKTRQPEQEIDENLFTDVYIDTVVKGWKGLKYKYLPELIPVDLSNVKDLDEELEYTKENARELLKNSIPLDSWVTEVVSDVANFNKNS